MVLQSVLLWREKNFRLLRDAGRSSVFLNLVCQQFLLQDACLVLCKRCFQLCVSFTKLYSVFLINNTQSRRLNKDTAAVTSLRHLVGAWYSH